MAIKRGNKARMLGLSNRFGCGCCTDDPNKARSRRASRRREKQQWKKEVSR